MTFLHYLQIPLRTAPLLAIAIFSVLVWLGFSAGLPGFVLVGILTSWLFKYAFVLLDHIVEGFHEPPALSLEMVNPAEQRPLGLLLIMLVLYLLTRELQHFIGDTLVMMLRIGFVLLLPAMVAVMSVTGRFIDCLNAKVVVRMVLRIPLRYLQLIAQIVAIVVALWLCLYVIGKINLGFPLSLLLAYASSAYLWLAMFACVGGLIYENRFELGVEPANSPERSAAKQSREIERARDKIVDRIFAQWRGGALADAKTSAQLEIEQAPEPLEEFRWLYARVVAWPDQRMAVHLLRTYLPHLLAQRNKSEPMELVRKQVIADPSFRPADGAQLLMLVTLARAAGDRNTVRCLLSDYERHFSDDRALPLIAKFAAALHS